MAKQADPRWIAAIFRDVPVHPFDGGERRIGDEIERGTGAQFVVDDDRDDSARRQLGRNECEILLVLGPPIAAVHEDMHWRGLLGRHGGEDVEAAQLVLAIGQIEMWGEA